MLKGLLKDAATYSVSSFIAKGIGFFLIPLYTRYLVPSDYGIIDILHVFMAFALVIVSGEIFQGVARFFPEMGTEEEKTTCASTTLMSIVSAFLVFTVICFLFSGSMATTLFGDVGKRNIVQSALPWIVLNALLETCQIQLRSDLRSAEYSIR